MKLLFTNTYVENSISSVQLLRCAQLFATPWTAVCQASLSITNSQSRLKLMSIKSVMPSNHLILCCPLLFPPSSFPASGSFPRSQFFASGGQSMDIHDWFPLGLTCLISLPSKGLSRVFSNTTVQEHHSLVLSFPYSTTFTSIHDTGKTTASTRCTFLGKVMSLLSNVVSKVGHGFSSKEQVSFNFMAAVTICSDSGAPKYKVFHCFHCFSIYFPWSNGTRYHDPSFLNVEF